MNVNGLLTKRWLSHLESNQNSGYQKPVCSRYTMGQAELRILYHISFTRRPRVVDCLCYAGLPSSVRLCFGQPCSPFEAGALPVLRPARRIHIRLRGRVLCNPPRLKGFRPASAQNKAAHGTLGSWANGACVRLSLRGKARLLPRAASTVRSAILRRRDTTSSSRARPLAHHANCRRAVPLRSLITHAPLARPSTMARFLS